MECWSFVIIICSTLFVEVEVIRSAWVASFLVPVAYESFGLELGVEVRSLFHDEVSIHSNSQLHKIFINHITFITILSRIWLILDCSLRGE